MSTDTNKYQERSKTFAGYLSQVNTGPINMAGHYSELNELATLLIQQFYT